jgi:siroheme synthase
MRRTQTQSLVLVDVVALLGKKTVVYPSKRTMTSFDHAFMVVQGLSLLMAAAAAAGLPLRTKGSDRRKKSLRECLI